MKHNSIENLLPSTPEFHKRYHQLINLGKQYLADQDIIILGLVRNAENKIDNNINRLCELGKTAKSYRISLFENDSRDKTVEKLKNIKENNSFIDLESRILNRRHFGSTQELERTTALAEYRNFLRLEVEKKYSQYNYTIVCDTDFNDFSMNGIYNSFGWFSLINTIDAIAGNSFELKHTFNQEMPSLWNYDSWAFRYMWWYFPQLTDETILNQKNSGLFPYDPNIWFGFFIPPLGSPLIPVNSAFGGMTIYKTDKYITGEYGGYDCEHVCFHRSLKEKYPIYNIYLNPSQAMLV